MHGVPCRSQTPRSSSVRASSASVGVSEDTAEEGELMAADGGGDAEDAGGAGGEKDGGDLFSLVDDATPIVLRIIPV